jgi:GntR family transcriptional regulator/MocR family aminotransferase
LRGVVCHPQQIVIGAEQHLLMHLLGVMLQDFSPSIAVENPCYPLIPSAFRQQGYEVVPLTEADQCISAARLEQMNARILAVAPSHQFPGGRIMTIQERLDLLQWAKVKRACIIEDDYGGELRYQGKPIAALQGLDPAAMVVYVGGFSQIHAPDLCIHYMVLPEALLEPFHEVRRKLMFELSSSRIYQRTLQKFMQHGFFDKHVRKMRNLYRKKNHQLTESLETEFHGIGEVINADTGLHLILKVKGNVSEGEMVEAARKQGIHIAAASPFYWGDAPLPAEEKQFIIGFGGISSERIDAGVRRLREIWGPYFE